MYLRIPKSRLKVMQRELAERKNWFFFEIGYPQQNGPYQRIFFFAEFPYAEAAIQWTIRQRTKMIGIHTTESSNDHRRVTLRFLNKDETPPRWAKISYLKNAESAHISQILDLPCS